MIDWLQWCSKWLVERLLPPCRIFGRYKQGGAARFAFRGSLLGPSWGPSYDRPENGSFSNVLCGLIAGSQPSKFDFRSFSKLLPNQFLLQIELSGSTHWSQHLLCAPNCGAPIPPDQGGVTPDRRLTFCWGSLSSRSGQLLTRAGKHTACRSLKQAHAR